MSNFLIKPLRSIWFNSTDHSLIISLNSVHCNEIYAYHSVIRFIDSYMITRGFCVCSLSAQSWTPTSSLTMSQTQHVIMNLDILAFLQVMSTLWRIYLLCVNFLKFNRHFLEYLLIRITLPLWSLKPDLTSSGTNRYVKFGVHIRTPIWVGLDAWFS